MDVGSVIITVFVMLIGILIGAGAAGSGKPKVTHAPARDVNYALVKAGIPDAQVVSVISELTKSGINLTKGDIPA